MRKLLVASVVVVVLGAVDVMAKSWAESQIESRARNEGGAEASASASIHSFPFLGRLLLTGSAGDVDLRMHDVAAQQLKFSTVGIDLVDVRLDRNKLFSGDAELRSIDKGTITVGFSAEDLSEQLKVPVTIDDGKISVTVRGATAVATPVATAEGSVRLQVQGLPAFNVPIPQTRLVSCPVAKVEVDDGELRASCTVEEIPPALLRVASRAAVAR